MGIATLEIILAMTIIAIFATITVPKMARVLDKVALNYEMKRLYSELNFVRSLSKIAWFKPSIFKDKLDTNTHNDVRITVYKSGGYYELFRNIDNQNYPINKHYLPRGFKINYSNLNMTITFDNDGSARNADINRSVANGHYILNSKLNDKAYIIFDSVGRFRGSYEAPK